MTEERNIVLRVEDDMDRKEIYATTYQLRNPFHQFADAVAGELDVMNYHSLAFAADLCPHGGKVLDMCSGRGLLIPFLRYRARQADLYVGVDLAAKNAAIWTNGYDPRRRGKVEREGGWDFPTIFVESSVAEMVEPLSRILGEQDPTFHLIVYTSAIEHMQPQAQQASLKEAARVANNDTRLYLTCPVTEEGKSGYDCQYRAHVYEPKDSELKEWLQAAGWRVERELGLVTKVSQITKTLKGSRFTRAKQLLRDMPRELALPVIARLFPECATEKAYICALQGASKRRRQEIPTPPPGGGLMGFVDEENDGA